MSLSSKSLSDTQIASLTSSWHLNEDLKLHIPLPTKTAKSTPEHDPQKQAIKDHQQSTPTRDDVIQKLRSLYLVPSDQLASAIKIQSVLLRIFNLLPAALRQTVSLPKEEAYEDSLKLLETAHAYSLVQCFASKFQIPSHVNDVIRRAAEIRERIKHLTEDESKFLSVEMKDLPFLPPEITQIGICELYLRKMGLTEIPPCVLKMKELQILDLSENRITTIAPEIATLSNLCVLLLNNNALQTIPKEIGKLKSLMILSANDNHLTQLPSSLFQLEQLSSLTVRNNRITQVPKFPPSLSSAVFDHNRLFYQVSSPLSGSYQAMLYNSGLSCSPQTLEDPRLFLEAAKKEFQKNFRILTTEQRNLPNDPHILCSPEKLIRTIQMIFDFHVCNLFYSTEQLPHDATILEKLADQICFEKHTYTSIYPDLPMPLTRAEVRKDINDFYDMTGEPSLPPLDESFLIKPSSLTTSKSLS